MAWSRSIWRKYETEGIIVVNVWATSHMTIDHLASSLLTTFICSWNRNEFCVV